MLTQASIGIFETVGGLGRATTTPATKVLPDLTGVGGIYYYAIVVQNNYTVPVQVVFSITQPTTPDYNLIGLGSAVVTPSRTDAPSGVTFAQSQSITLGSGKSTQLWFKRNVSQHTGVPETAQSILIIEASV